MLKSKRNKILLFVVLLIVGLSLFIYKNNQPITQYNTTRNEYNPQIQRLELKTKVLPYLEPHPHSEGDSVFNPDHHEELISPNLVIEEDSWITNFEVSIQNAPLVTIHHARLAMVGNINADCEQAFDDEIAIISGELFGSNMQLPEGYGYFVPKGTELFAYSMMHNPLPPYGPGEDYYDVAVSYLIDVQPDTPETNLKPVSYERIHLTDNYPCGYRGWDQTFVVPANTKDFVKHSSDQTEFYEPSRMTFEEDGTIIYSFTHIHPAEGGEKIDAYLNGKIIKTFYADTSVENIWEATTPHDTEAVRVKKGDELTVSATYTNKSHIPDPAAMGNFIFYFAPDQE